MGWLIRIDAELLKQALIQAVVFLVYFVVIKKFFYDKINGIIKSRKEKITTDLNAAKEANDSAKALEAQYSGRLEEIENERFEIVKKAAAEGEVIKGKIVDEGRQQATSIINSAKKEIEAERVRAQQEFKDSIVDLSIEAAEKIVEKSLNKEDHIKLINDSISMFKEV